MRAETHVADPPSAHVFLRVRIPPLPNWVPRLRPRRGPKHVKTRAERTRAETHVADPLLRTRIFTCPIPPPPSWVPRLPPRRGPKHVKTRAERTRAETHVADPPSPHTYFYVSNSASCCSTPLRWRASGPQTKREPWAGALTGKTRAECMRAETHVADPPHT